MAHNKKLILTGASGWFGKTALFEYEQVYGPQALRSNVVACCSIPRKIDIGSPYGPISSIGLADLPAISGATGLIHLAFLTRDRLKDVEVSSYISQNRAITDLVSQFIDFNPGIPIITTSSGAVAKKTSDGNYLSIDPYAVLKRKEEAVWRHKSQQRMALVFRVYAASGKFIKNPSLFALSDFISKAIAGQRIQIHSRRKVIRSYVHVGTMMRLFWALLSKPCTIGFRQVDAVMYTLSLTELAEIISEIWGLPVPVSQIDATLTPDDYQGDPAPFQRLLSQHSIQSPSLSEQLSEVAMYMHGANKLARTYPG